MSVNTPICTRYCKSVATGVTDDNDYVVPAGKTLCITSWGANSAHVSSVHVGIKWDGVNQFFTHGDYIEDNPCEFVGDGTKKLTIRLKNNSGNSETIGAFYKGYLYDT